MTPEVFNKLASGLLSQAAKVRNTKMIEYVGEVDRLANFRKAAALTGTTVPTIIRGMMIKHTVSICDMIEADFGCNPNIEQPHSIELWREKLIDQINYLLLLYGAVREAKDESIC